jgi:hypothetical protein
MFGIRRTGTGIYRGEPKGRRPVMGMMDNMKDKAKEAVREHGDKIAGGLDKAKEMAKEKTGGKHDDKIDKGADRARRAVEDFKR